MLRVHEAPCSAKNRNDMFSNYVLFKKGHLNKTAGVWTPPGSATADDADEMGARSNEV